MQLHCTYLKQAVSKSGDESNGPKTSSQGEPSVRGNVVNPMKSGICGEKHQIWRLLVLHFLSLKCTLLPAFFKVNTSQLKVGLIHMPTLCKQWSQASILLSNKSKLVQLLCFLRMALLSSLKDTFYGQLPPSLNIFNVFWSLVCKSIQWFGNISDHLKI